jgi:peroxiredoxin
LGLFGVVACAALIGCGPSTAGDPKTPEGDQGLLGKPAPELDVESVGGDGPTTIAEAKGQVAIVDFWATYCQPCRKSFPKYQDLVDKYAGKVVVIGVSVDDPEDKTAEDLVAYAAELNVSFPLVWDKNQKTAAAYSPPKMPTSYIVDTEGVIRHIHAGYKADESEEIEKEVEALLK